MGHTQYGEAHGGPGHCQEDASEGLAVVGLAPISSLVETYLDHSVAIAEDLADVGGLSTPFIFLLGLGDTSRVVVVGGRFSAGIPRYGESIWGGGVICAALQPVPQKPPWQSHWGISLRQEQV